MSGAPAVALQPERGSALEVAPGVVWVRMELPFALDHVNLWLIADVDGWTLVDTGHGDEGTAAAWERLAPAVLGRRPLRRVVVTHHHPDHIGLSAWLTARFGAELWCTRTEWLQARALSLRPLNEASGLARAYYRRAGVPAAAVPRLVACARSYPDAVSVTPSFRRIRGGDELLIGGDRWRVIVGGGHAPEHACLHSPARGLLISGDQVLPHITPNVSIWPMEPGDEPLSEFLRAAQGLAALPEETLVLPSHGRPFHGLRRRCEELAAHHRARLDAVEMACRRPLTAFAVMAVLFDRPLDPHQTTFAIGEALAHLNHLVAQGRVARVRPARGPDRFVRIVSGERMATTAA
ncbi:MAG TPA: MBL fold metallo-hydrolase [Anaeromyxobacteraceae bacterium]|nr:MBL fold metallo-hydrolase [Anaeromyxobacteraceae bacterium]